MRALLAALLLALPAFAAPTLPGVPQELAKERAKILSGLRYHLSVKITEHSPVLPGHETLDFSLSSNANPLVLDFRDLNAAGAVIDGRISHVVINGTPVQPAQENGHILLPAANLRSGANHVEMDFESAIAAANRAITRVTDPLDSSEYLYTLFVPMDASLAFPCFDQPDLKAKFTFDATAPANWTVISNTAAATGTPSGVFHFPETHPISTYLFAFAAGPFEAIAYEGGQVPMRLLVRKSMLAKAKQEWPEVADYTRKGMEQMSKFFAQPYPFPKYDQVLLPGFPYGGMEHAGATFLREDVVIFRTAPTATDHQRRSVTVLHELAHQWFGDLVTMRWFDDLWLKEGFAQYMAFHTLAELEPPAGVWKRFYETIKPVAYNIDETQGTAPIYQEVRNLADAKSAYGPIVYQKAPSLLQVLNYKLGEDNFRGGVQIFLREHAYANATWQDLIGAFSRAAKQDLSSWANTWVRQRGMPVVTVNWSCSGGKISTFTVAQKDSLGEGHLWPISTQMQLGATTLPVTFSAASAKIPAALGKPCPAYVFGNSGDHAYGRFLPDARSLAGIQEDIAKVKDPLARALYWGALWDSVREAELSPSAYVELAIRTLPGETDLDIVQSVTGRAGTAIRTYVPEREKATLAAKYEALLLDRMKNSPERDFRISAYRSFTGSASSPAALAEVQALLDGKSSVPGVTLQQRDRWNLLSTLVRQGVPKATDMIQAELVKDKSEDGKRSAYAALAGIATPENKAKYFAEYLKDGAVPEDFATASLGSFNAGNQEALTLPYVARALEALPQLKLGRKIFFINGWLSSFVGSHTSAAAETAVEEYLSRKDIDPDLRLKVLQVKAELDRTLRIRTRWR